MPGNLIAVADGRDSLFATLDTDGAVSVWSGRDEVRCRFIAEFARAVVPVRSGHIAIVAGEEEATVVVGSWTRGVAAFGLDGQVRWHRQDIRHVQGLRAVPGADGRGQVLAVVRERGTGLVLGRSGGTRYQVPGARFLDGWPDGSLLVFNGKQASRRAAPYSGSSWSIDLAAFAVLDAVVGDGALICGADGSLVHAGDDGEVRWRVTTGKGRRAVRAWADPHGAGWVCLAPTNVSGSVPRVLRITREGVIAASADCAGTWIGFAFGGRCLVAADGTVCDVPDLAPVVSQ